MKQNELKAPSKRTEALSIWIIFGSVLLCIAVSFWEYQDNQKAVRSAVQAVTGEVLVTQLSDPLLVLVNDWSPLPENWQVIPRMVDDEQVDLRMYDNLMAMFKAAEKDNVWFWVASGYRSVKEQEIILDRAVAENIEQGMGEEEAKEEALRTIARPGYSEHHTGLAVDLNDVSADFETTEAYKWLTEHAAEYGFVQRYRADKVAITGIDNESWHYRYVGKKNAQEMERLNFCLEEYVEYLKKRGIR